MKARSRHSWIVTQLSEETFAPLSCLQVFVTVFTQDYDTMRKSSSEFSSSLQVFVFELYEVKVIRRLRDWLDQILREVLSFQVDNVVNITELPKH